MPSRRAKAPSNSSVAEGDELASDYSSYSASNSMVEVRAALKTLGVKVPGSARSKQAHLDILHATLAERGSATTVSSADKDSDGENFAAKVTAPAPAPMKSSRSRSRARSRSRKQGKEEKTIGTTKAR